MMIDVVIIIIIDLYGEMPKASIRILYIAYIMLVWGAVYKFSRCQSTSFYSDWLCLYVFTFMLHCHVGLYSRSDQRNQSKFMC